MPIAYSHDPLHGLIRTVVTGRVTPPEVADYFHKIKAETWYPAPSLTDCREASANMSVDELREITDYFRQFDLHVRRFPIAVVVSSNMAYGLVRMTGLLLDEAANIRPFQDIERAMDWLGPKLQSVSSKS
jgi:hypothetical protein